jgi:hypothetical protein
VGVDGFVGVGVGVGVFVGVGVGVEVGVFVGVDVGVFAWAVWVAMMLIAAASALRSASEGPQATKITQIIRNNKALKNLPIIFI